MFFNWNYLKITVKIHVYSQLPPVFTTTKISISTFSIKKQIHYSNITKGVK